MKKILCLVLCCIFSLGAFSTVSYAATNDDYAVMPCLNNTAITNTGFVIDDNGISLFLTMILSSVTVHSFISGALNVMFIIFPP